MIVGDNYRFDVTAVRDDGAGAELLRHALELAFATSSRANHWRVVREGKQSRLTLAVGHSSDLPGYTRMPVMADAAYTHMLVTSWLTQEDYPEEPDHDGSNLPGWRVWCDNGGRIEGEPRGAFVAVEPTWIWMGK